MVARSFATNGSIADMLANIYAMQTLCTNTKSVGDVARGVAQIVGMPVPSDVTRIAESA